MCTGISVSKEEKMHSSSSIFTPQIVAFLPRNGSMGLLELMMMKMMRRVVNMSM
jgi:hypothetical protein